MDVHVLSFTTSLNSQRRLCYVFISFIDVRLLSAELLRLKLLFTFPPQNVFGTRLLCYIIYLVYAIENVNIHYEHIVLQHRVRAAC